MPSPLTLPVRYGRRQPPLVARVRPGAPLGPRGGLVFLDTLAAGAGNTTFPAVGGVRGTFVGGPTWTATPLGRGLALSGAASQYVTYGHPPFLSALSRFTIIAWFTPQRTADSRIVSQWQGGGGANTFNWVLVAGTNTAGKFGLYTTTDGSSVLYSGDSTTTFAVGTQYMVAGLADGSTASIAVNGRVQNAVAQGAVFTGGAMELQLGESDTSGCLGDVGYVAIYDRALRPQELLSLYVRPYQMF